LRCAARFQIFNLYPTRYMGTDPEPRPGLPSGHIPKSFSLPFNIVLRTHFIPENSASRTFGSKYTTLLETSEIQKALIAAVGAEQADLVVKGKRRVTTSCGSGMTAAVLWLGLKTLGVEAVALYDEVSPFSISRLR
jgi:thiosulfate/3-mercaptopyruvate sulfurtransferase